MLNFSKVSQDAHNGLSALAEEMFGEIQGEVEEIPQEESQEVSGDEEEGVVPEEETGDNAPEQPSDEQSEEPGENAEDPLEEALRKARAELEGEQQKNKVLAAKAALPPVPQVVPFDKLSEEDQSKVLEYCREFNLDPYKEAHDIQVRYRDSILAQHQSLDATLAEAKMEAAKRIDAALLGHPKASEHKEFVAKKLQESRFMDHVNRMDSQGVHPSAIEEWARMTIEQAYALAEDDKRNKQRVLAAVNKQKAQLKKATRGETSSPSSSPTQKSSQGDMDKLIESAFSRVKSPFGRLFG